MKKIISILCSAMLISVPVYPSSPRPDDVEKVKNYFNNLARTAHGLESTAVKYNFLKYQSKKISIDMTDALLKDRDNRSLEDARDYFRDVNDELVARANDQYMQRLKDDKEFASSEDKYLDQLAQEMVQRVDTLSIGFGILILGIGLLGSGIMNLLRAGSRNKYQERFPYIYIPSENDYDASLLHCPAVSYPAHYNHKKMIRTTPITGSISDDGAIKITVEDLRNSEDGMLHKSFTFTTSVEEIRNNKKMKKDLMKGRLAGTNVEVHQYNERLYNAYVKEKFDKGYRPVHEFALSKSGYNGGYYYQTNYVGLETHFRTQQNLRSNPRGTDDGTIEVYCPTYDQFIQRIQLRVMAE